MAERTFAGKKDLSGQLVGTLRVGSIVGRRGGSPLWSGVCVRCLSEGTYEHDPLVRGESTCKSAGCGREQVRAALADTPAKYRRRIAESEARQRREAEAKQAAKQAALEAEYKATANALAKTMRDGLSTVPDENVMVDPTTIGISMTPKAAEEFNRAEAEKFLNSRPEARRFWNKPSFDALQRYFDLNGLRLVSALSLDAAFIRLREFGLLTESPASTPSAPPPPVRVNLSVEPIPTEPSPRIHIGVNNEGRQREFTDIEVERMTAREFKSAFRLHQPDVEAAKAWGRR